MVERISIKIQTSQASKKFKFKVVERMLSKKETTEEEERSSCCTKNQTGEREEESDTTYWHIENEDGGGEEEEEGKRGEGERVGGKRERHWLGRERNKCGRR